MIEKIGRYEVIRPLGRGGMAEVYLAQDGLMDRQVAIKLLPPYFLHDPQFKTRFEREAKVLAKLADPSVVPVYDFGYHEGQPYMVSRYMTGGSLLELLQKESNLSLQSVLDIVRPLCAALDAMHKKGIVHRDIKPGNILFDEEGRAYLADFGIAKLAKSTSALTGTALIGTPAYMSPEQFEGEEELDGRSDQYSLAIVLFEMLSGQPPFVADSTAKLMRMHLMEPAPVRKLRAGLPEGLSVVLERALSKKPAQRYTNMKTFLSALEKAQLSASTPAKTKRPAPAKSTVLLDKKKRSSEGSQPPTRKPVGLVVGACIGLALLGIVGIVILALVFNSITSDPAPRNTPVAQATRTPTRPATQAPLPTAQTFAATSPTLFQDDFSDTSSGWDRSTYDDGSQTDYVDNGYHILVNGEYASVWANPGISATDVSVEVDGVKRGGVDDNEFGVICRYVDGSNFYAGSISSDGFYAIVKIQNGEFGYVGSESMQFSERILQGAQVNRVRLDCVGSTITLYANGSQLISATDTSFASGDVGLYAGTFATSGVDIFFDDFVVRRP